MTTDELKNILYDDSFKLSIKELREVLYELSSDCLKESERCLDRNYLLNDTGVSEGRYYLGECNAFRICLDLLEHLRRE